MTTTPSHARRLLLAGVFGLAAVAAPIAAALTGPATPLATCPSTEVLDPSSGACKPISEPTSTTFNPINPENAPLQPGEITSSRPGNVGSLPEVDGIPCTGAQGGNSSVGECIGLQQEFGQHGNGPTLQTPLPTVSSSG